MAIAETLHERHPQAGIWPADPAHRAVARCLAAEMHSSFTALRSACPMNIHRAPAPLRETPAAVAADAARIGLLWSWAIARTGGPWLGGPRFSAADAFYAPVALRLQEYVLGTPATDEYTNTLLKHNTVSI